MTKCYVRWHFVCVKMLYIIMHDKVALDKDVEKNSRCLHSFQLLFLVGLASMFGFWEHAVNSFLEVAGPCGQDCPHALAKEKLLSEFGVI